MYRYFLQNRIEIDGKKIYKPYNDSRLKIVKHNYFAKYCYIIFIKKTTSYKKIFIFYVIITMYNALEINKIFF